MIWRGICFNVPLGALTEADWVGAPITHEGKQIGVISKVVTDVDNNCQRVYAELNQGVDLSGVGDELEVSIGCRA